MDAQWHASDRSSETVVAREYRLVAPGRGLSEFGATSSDKMLSAIKRRSGLSLEGTSDRTKSESKRAPVARARDRASIANEPQTFRSDLKGVVVTVRFCRPRCDEQQRADHRGDNYSCKPYVPVIALHQRSQSPTGKHGARIAKDAR